MNYWLVKQEPEDYAWAAFVKEGQAAWTGVRNYQARNNLRAMKKGDLVLYYHSGTGKKSWGWRGSPKKRIGTRRQKKAIGSAWI